MAEHEYCGFRGKWVSANRAFFILSRVNYKEQQQPGNYRICYVDRMKAVKLILQNRLFAFKGVADF